MMNIITWIFRIVVFAILVVFTSRNSHNVQLEYYFDQTIELPLSVLLLIFFALGTLVTVIFVKCRCHSQG